jgi:hypothetical protein
MKIIYFTAGEVPTTNEKNDIAALNALAVAPFEVVVRAKNRPLDFGAGVEDADYAAFVSGGSAPAPYDDTEDYPVFLLSAPKASALPATNAIIKSGQKISGVTGAGANVVATITVANGQISAIACATS